VLRDDGKDVAAIVSSREYALFRKWLVDGLTTAMNELAAEAAANGLTEEKLAELLKQPD
jgi:Asp-tRNA(Asn)/Glu-tRNA(Gln) amidotransferase B subunit